MPDLSEKSIVQDRDLRVSMRDGTHLFANLFRPPDDRPHPVIISVTPYGKDKLPDRLSTFFMRVSGVKFGKLNCSHLTGFESPDPAYWVKQGYAVLQADVRGMHKSEGQAGVLRPKDAEDCYDLIDWAASTHRAAPHCDPGTAITTFKSFVQAILCRWDRDLAIGHILREWFQFAANDPGSRCGEVPGLCASQTRQSWVAHHIHGRTL